MSFRTGTLRKRLRLGMVVRMCAESSPQTQPPCSAAILAGGAATRMGGVQKALLDVCGRPILDLAIDTLCGFFDDLIVVCKDPAPLRGHLEAHTGPVRMALDSFEARSSLTGIHAALENARHPHCFVMACDAALVRPELVQALLDHLRPEDDVVIPRKPDGYYEPLCAIYSRRCLEFISAQLAAQDYKIIHFFGQVQVRPLPVEVLLRADPDLVSFQNANTPEDLRKLRDTAQSLLRPRCDPAQEGQ